MDTTEHDHIGKLIDEYTRRFRILQLQQAKQGPATRPEVIIELEDIQQEIGKLNSRLQRGSIMTVDLISYRGAATSGGAQERLDWADSFQSVPSAEVWTTDLFPNLKALKQRLVD